MEEIAVIQNLYSEAVEERKSAQGQLAKALEELEKARGELEDSKKLLQDTIDGAAKNLEDLKATHEREMNTCVENAGKIHNQKEMKAELAKKDRRITNLEEERDQLARDRDQLRENRDEIKQERDDLKKENEALDDQRKAKEKEAELNAAQKNQLQNEVQQLREQSRSVTESLQTEIREVKEQLTVALAGKEALGDESLAKTQQVKQYKKQVDNFRIQLAESNAKIEQCEQQINNLRIQLAESNSRIEQYQTRLRQSESDLEYCRRDLQAREEDEESKVRYIIYSTRPTFRDYSVFDGEELGLEIVSLHCTLSGNHVMLMLIECMIQLLQENSIPEIVCVLLEWKPLPVTIFHEFN